MFINMFPKNIKDCLDRILLQMLVLDVSRMKDNYALFLYQLILPMCSLIKSLIRKDPRKYYYSEVEKCSNIYADNLGLGGSYSKKFEHIIIYYLVQWDGVLLPDGVRGVSKL